MALGEVLQVSIVSNMLEPMVLELLQVLVLCLKIPLFSIVQSCGLLWFWDGLAESICA